VVGERVVRAMRGRELDVFTHMEQKEWLMTRHHAPPGISDAYDDCERWIAERADIAAGYAR
jgi:hypothetical protein